jgi:RHS repeat-associated protein
VETDGRKAPMRVRDNTGAVVWSWDNPEPYGNSAPNEGLVGGSPFVFNLRYPGQWFDGSTGLVFNGYRDYNPSLGRYMEVDPLGLAAGMNPYAYVGGNPLTAVDPLGLSGFSITSAITGFGDGVNVLGFSPSENIRSGWGLYNPQCNPSYLTGVDVGRWFSVISPATGRIGYITRVAEIPGMVDSVEGAYAARVAVKAEYRSVFRGVVESFDRDPSLDYILEKEKELGSLRTIERSGVTSFKWNIGILGASVFSGLNKIISGGPSCGCRNH